MPLDIAMKRHLSAIVVAALLSACGGNDADKFIASAKQYLDKGNYHAAGIELKNALQKAPENAEGRYLLGMTLLKEGQAEAAEIELRKAQSAGRSADEVEPLLVKSLTLQGKSQTALDTVSMSRATNPAARAELKALAGESYLQLGRRDEARKAFEEAHALSGSNLGAQLGLAKVAAIGQQFDEAIKILDALSKEQADDPETLLLRADVQLSSKHESDAMATYNRAIAADPGNPKAYLVLIPHLLKSNDVAGARTRVDELKKRTPGSIGTVYLDALVNYAEHKLPAARDLILTVLKVAPQHLQALLLAGSIEVDSGNLTQAEDHLAKVLQINPGLSAVRRTLAGLYLRGGDPERAKDELSKLMQRGVEDPSLYALSGEVALATGQTEEAARWFQKAVAANPKDTQSLVRLGQAKYAAGNAKEGIDVLERALSADPNAAQAEMSLVSIYLSKRDTAKALAAADDLIKKHPDNVAAYQLRATAHLVGGNEARAREDLEHALKLRASYFPAARMLANLDLRKGDAAGAKRRYDGILAADPKNVQALLALAEIAVRASRESNEAQSLIDRAIEANPKSPAARIAKARYLVGKGDKQGALAAAQQAAVVMPDSPAILELLGRAQLTTGDSNQAISTFAKLSALLPKSPTPLAAQAEAYAASKDWENARRALNKALQLDKNSLQLKLGLVQASMMANEPERALNEIHEIQKESPDKIELYATEARILLVQKKVAEAERVLRTAQAKYPSATSTIALVTFLNSQGKPEEGEALASQWIRQHPNDVGLATAQGQSRMSAKDYESAARWWRIALKASPDAAVLLNNLAWTLNQMKDPSALEVAEKAYKLAPDSAAIMDTLGTIRVARGDLDKGIDLISRAHQMAPNNAEVTLNLAKALLKAGRKQDAKTHLDALMKLPAEAPIRKEAQSLLAQG